MGKGLFGNTAPVIRHLDFDHSFFGIINALQDEGPPVLHGIDGIENKVDHTLLYLVEVSPNFRDLLGQMGYDLDILKGELVLTQKDAFFQQGIRIHLIEFHFRFPGKGKEI